LDLKNPTLQETVAHNQHTYVCIIVYLFLEHHSNIAAVQFTESN